MQSKDISQTKVFITGGHLTPALAVVEELQRKNIYHIIWIGRKKTMARDKNFSAEYMKVSEEMKIKFLDLRTGKIVRFTNVTTLVEFLVNLVKLPVGFFQSLYFFLKYKPQLIISFGGYVAVPVVVVAKMFGTPAITHEQTVVTGMANKVVSRFVNKICLSWAQSKKFFDNSKVVITGNPLRKEVLVASTDIFILNEKLKTIYVTGGNQGAHILNNIVEKIIEKLLTKYNVIHQTGVTSVTNDYERLSKLEHSFYKKTKGTYIVRGNIYGAEIGEIFKKANFIISRSGANTLTEILALGTLSILIPIPWSINDEQLKNAKMLEKIGLSKVIEEKDITPDTLLNAIEEGMICLRKNKSFTNKDLAATRAKAKSLIHFDAAEKIVSEAISLL